MARSHSRRFTATNKWRSVSTSEPPAPSEPDTSTEEPSGTRAFTAEELSNMDAKDLAELVGHGRVQKVMSREKETGRRSAERQVMEALGFSNLDDARSWIAGKRDEEAAQLSDAERARREAETVSAQAEADRRQAAADRQAAKVERALIRLGVNDDALGDASRLIDIEPDADEAAITTTVEALKSRIPALFATSTAPTPPAPSGSPGAAPPRPTPAGDAYQRGVERAKKLAAEASGG